MIVPPASTVVRHAQENHIHTAPDPIRVASIPAAHPYVRSIAHPQRVRVLPDPPVPGAPATQWWPPVALTPQWLDGHAADYDVLHVHFGLESLSPDALGEALATARQLGRPIVYTVHDLDNPQLVDQEPYRTLLDVIIPAADQLITLTAAAAAEIAQRWHRESRVLTHPTLLESEATIGHRHDGGIRIGIALRDLRPNIAAEEGVAVAARAAELLADAGTPVEVDVLMSERVRDDEAAARVIAAASAHPSVQVRRTPHLTDAEIESWLGELDLFLLPYRHGTHSGWVELCHDLGVPVAGADVGHIAAQHPHDFHIIDLDEPHTLSDAVQQVLAAAPSSRPDLVRARQIDRLAHRAAVRDAHVRLYAAALTEVHA